MLGHGRRSHDLSRAADPGCPRRPRAARVRLAAEQGVALLLPDGLEWVAVFFGALRLGVVAVLLNTRLEPTVWAGRVVGRRYKSLYRSHAAAVGGPGNVFDRNNRIDAILIQKIDATSLGALR